MVILGAGLLFLSYVLFSIRSNTAESTVERDMTIFALGWLLYGLGSLFAVLRFPIEGGESTMNYI